VLDHAARGSSRTLEEVTMAGIGRYKLSDAIPRSQAGGRPAGGSPSDARVTEVEQVRQAQESRKARNAGVSTRERMVDIGRGQQQAGRQGS